MKPAALAFMVPGVLLVVFGAIDLIGSFAGFDLWHTMGVALPEVIWRFSAYIEIAAGLALLKLGRQQMESGAPA